jgi:preprotein translocase SecE subunit
MGYKRDQGRMARMAAFWTLAALLFYGSTSLNDALSGYWPGLAAPLLAGMPTLPVLSIGLTPAFFVALLVFVGGMFLLYRWLEQPKSAELLIETEHELRKVTWPTLPEVVNSSLIVIFCVLFLMGFLAAADWFIALVTDRILFGGA